MKVLSDSKKTASLICKLERVNAHLRGENSALLSEINALRNTPSGIIPGDFQKGCPLSLNRRGIKPLPTS